MVLLHEDHRLPESLDLCLQLELSDICVISDLAEPMYVALHRLVHGQLCLIVGSKVISGKTGIVHLQNDVGTVHGICEDLSPQVLDGLEVMDPVSDLGSCLFRVLPDFTLHLPVFSLWAPHSVQVGGQMVFRLCMVSSFWIPPIPARPLVIPVARPLDPKQPGKLLEWDTEIRESEPPVAA